MLYQCELDITFHSGKLLFYCFMNKIFVDQLENDPKTDLKCMHFAIHSEGGHSTIVYTKLLSMCHYLNRQPKTGGSVWKRWKKKRPISSGIVIIWYGNRAMFCLKTALHFRVQGKTSGGLVCGDKLFLMWGQFLKFCASTTAINFQI